MNVQENSLEVTGLNVAQYTFANFSYNSTTHTATWTLASPIGADKLSLDLQSTGPYAVTDTSGDALDGEWTNSVSSYPSGNGVAGGDFNFTFNVLPGDVSQTGVVNAQSLAVVSSNWLTVGPAGDLNGDGIVNSQDLALISSQWLAAVPSGGAANVAPNSEIVSEAAFGSINSAAKTSDNSIQTSVSLAVGAAAAASPVIDSAMVAPSGSVANALIATNSIATLLSSGGANAATAVSNNNAGNDNCQTPKQSRSSLVAGTSQPEANTAVPAIVFGVDTTGSNSIANGSAPNAAAGALAPPTYSASDTPSNNVVGTLANVPWGSPAGDTRPSSPGTTVTNNAAVLPIGLLPTTSPSFITPQSVDHTAAFVGQPSLTTNLPAIDWLMSQHTIDGARDLGQWAALIAGSQSDTPSIESASWLDSDSESTTIAELRASSLNEDVLQTLTASRRFSKT